MFNRSKAKIVGIHVRLIPDYSFLISPCMRWFGILAVADFPHACTTRPMNVSASSIYAKCFTLLNLEPLWIRRTRVDVIVFNGVVTSNSCR